jgi:uncharacterized protein
VIGLGTVINAIAILIGGLIGLKARGGIAESHQNFIKGVLILLTLYAGLSMIWRGLNGTFGQVMGQAGIMFLALIVGNLLGKLLRVQDSLTKLGRYAQERFSKAQTDGRPPAAEGFVTCTLLFCVGPMSLLGAIQDGLTGDFRLLAIKGAMDGLATMGFATVFGASVLLAVLPVVAYQGTITLCAKGLEPLLSEAMMNSITATGGLVVLVIPLLILGVRRVPLADYLPSLVVAPLLTWWWL